MPRTNFCTLEVVRHGKCVDLPSIFEVNESCKDLVEMNLTGCSSVTLEGSMALAAIVRCCKNLQSFSYGSILTKTTILRVIIDALRQCKGLRTLSLTNMAGCVKLVANLLKCTSLSKLNIHIGEHGAHVLARHLRSSIVSLNISSCGIGDVGTVAIFQSLKFLSIHELDISSNGIRYQGALALAGGLKLCTHLTILDVSHNDIQNSGACALAKALVHCTKLTKLKISHNRIEGIGIKALVKVVEYWPRLKELDVSDNRFTVECSSYEYIKRTLKGLKHTFVARL